MYAQRRNIPKKWALAPTLHTYHTGKGGPPLGAGLASPKFGPYFEVGIVFLVDEGTSVCPCNRPAKFQAVCP